MPVTEIAMKVMNVCKLLATLFLVSAPVLAQQGFGGVEISPVPRYPGDGSDQLNSAFKDRHVFYDAATQEVVVSYPDAQQSGGQRVARFGRRNQVEPIVQSRIAAGAGGLYTYQYTVGNGVRARQGLNVFAVSAAAGDESLSTTGPSWAVSTSPSPVSRPGAIRPEVQVVWEAPLGRELGRGMAGEAFGITSAYRPGIVIGYAQSASSPPAAKDLISTFPEKVKEQLKVIDTPKWNAAQFMTIAPKFRASDPKQLIVADFERAVTQLAMQGPLTEDSAFVKGALSAFEAFRQAPEGTSVELGFLEKAAPGLESEIAAAIAMSLK